MSKVNKKILHVIPSLVIGGAENLLLNTIQLLRDYEHHVVCFEETTSRIELFQEVARVHLKKSSILSLSSFFFIRRLKNKLEPDIIHAHLLKANWLSRIAFPLSKKLFNSIHSPYGKDAFCFNKLSLLVEAISFKLSNVKLIFVSDYVKEDYADYISLKNSHFVLHNFVPKEYFALNCVKYAAMSELRLVAVGNIKPLKNYQLLIDAFKELRHLPVSIDVYGQGSDLHKFQEEVTKHKLPISFKGSIESLMMVLKEYHALMLPSRYEGFSIALIEAMAASMPVLLSDIPMFRQLAQKNAYFFNPEKVEECVQAISEAYKEGFSEEGIVENKEIVINNFSEEIYTKNLLAIYNEVSEQ